LAGETELLGGNFCLCHFVHHKSYSIEPGPPCWPGGLTYDTTVTYLYVFMYLHVYIYSEVALEAILQRSVHLPMPHFVKNRSNAELNVRSREVINAGYRIREKLAETKEYIRAHIRNNFFFSIVSCIR
jgi:hypothetical protein